MDVPQAPPKRRPVDTRISSEIRLCSRSTMPAAPIARVIDIRITYEQVIAAIPAVLGKGIGDRGRPPRLRSRLAALARPAHRSGPSPALRAPDWLREALRFR